MPLGIYWIQCILLATSAVCLKVEHLSISEANQSPQQFAIFSKSSFYSVPCGVNRLRVLVVGGGGGGGSGPAGGGSAGFVRSEVYEVEPKVVVKITVGKGGKGSTSKDNCRQDSQRGGRSSFGGFLYADGGDKHKGPCFDNWQGATGGSGGGEGCVYSKKYCHSGTGGSGGSDGSNASGGETFGFGRGQGNYLMQLRQFNKSVITAGAGGKGRLYAAAGGGGAGGININGLGPMGGNGAKPIGSQGGKGFGAGGGSGFYTSEDGNFSQLYHNGGDGADGVVYIEWWMEAKQSSSLFKIGKSNSGEEDECLPDPPPSNPSTIHPETTRTTPTSSPLTSTVTTHTSTNHPDTTRPTSTSTPLTSTVTTHTSTVRPDTTLASETSTRTTAPTSAPLTSRLTTLTSTVNQETTQTTVSSTPLLTTQQVIPTTTAAPVNYAIFKENGTFQVPMGVYLVRVLCVGGGSGGLSGYGGGGGSGHLNWGEFDVLPKETFNVTVGAGGDGSTYKDDNNQMQDSKAGGTSWFGKFLSANGGEGRSNNVISGASGHSGGGMGTCNTKATSGAGGTNGSSGERDNPRYCSYNIIPGTGRGAFSQNLIGYFKHNRLTAGNGGSGRTTPGPYFMGGSGGGGVLLNGSGPMAQAGTEPSSGGFGGAGFGAGGGAGGFINRPPHTWYAGGRGADGLVYVEWSNTRRRVEY